MAHIAHTLARKKAAQEAGNTPTTYKKYRAIVDKAQAAGYSIDDIIYELEHEADSIRNDTREGDPLYLQGVANSKTACLNAITLIISELKGSRPEGEN